MPILTLIDQEGTQIQIPVTKEQFEKANLDLLYAQKLFENFQKEHGVDNGQAEETEELGQDENNSTADDEINEKLWTKQNTLCFIRQYKSADEKFDITKEVWSNIAKSCTETFGKHVSIKACMEKWKSLKPTYKTIKLKNTQSGNRSCYWEYFEIIDSFMSKKPEIKPVATCSNLDSLQTSKLQNEICDKVSEDLENLSTSCSESLHGVKREQKLTDVERRHNEKLTRMDRFNDLFEKMVEKL